MSVVAAGNNGSYSAKLGNLTASGAAGGQVIVASVDAAKSNVTIGNINTSSSATVSSGGSVGVATLGGLTVGNVNTLNTAASAAAGVRSGSVFVSSGTALTVGNVDAFNSSNGSGSGSVVLASSGAIASGTVTTGAGSFGSFSNVGSGSATSMSGNLTISIKPSALSNYNPAGYSSLTAGTLTIDTNGDSSIIAPILATGSASVTSVVRSNTVTADSFALVSRDNITIGSTNLSGTSMAGDISLLSARGSITISGTNTSTAGTIGGDVRVWAPLGSIAVNGPNGNNDVINTRGNVRSGELVAVAGNGVSFAAGISTQSAGTGGNVTIYTGVNNLYINNQGLSDGLYKYVNTGGGTGEGGDFRLTVGSAVNQVDGSSRFISSGLSLSYWNNCDGCTQYSINTNSTSSNAGDIRLNVVSGNLALSRDTSWYCCWTQNERRVQLVAQSGSGKGGEISVRANGAVDGRINFYTNSGLSAGNVTVQTTGAQYIDGVIYAAGGGVGRGGDVRLAAVYGGIDVLSYIRATGGDFGGNVSLASNNRYVTVQGYDAANGYYSIGTNALLKGGDINVTAGSYFYSRNGLNTAGNVNGGNVNLAVTAGYISIPNGFWPDFSLSHINTQGGGGDGGNVNISIGRAVMQSSGYSGFIGWQANYDWDGYPEAFPRQISSGRNNEYSINTSSVSGRAGDISVVVDSGHQGFFGGTAAGPSHIQFVANSQLSDGGDITILTKDGAINGAYTFAANGANGGDISVRSQNNYVNLSSTVNFWDGSLATGWMTANGTTGRAGDISVSGTSISMAYATARGGVFGGLIDIAASTGGVNLYSNSAGSSADVSASVKAGNISISAFTGITTQGGLNASAGSAGVSGGNVFLNIAGIGNVSIPSINVSGVNGSAGSVLVNFNQTALVSGSAGFQSNTAITASSFAGLGGNVEITVAAGDLGCFGCSGSSALNINASSQRDKGGNITVDVANSGQTNWTMNASGTNGGVVAMRAGNLLSNTGAVTAAGSADVGGDVAFTAVNNLSFSALQANGARTGGSIVLSSTNGNITGSSTISATGVFAGGNVRVLAGNGVSVAGNVSVSSSSGTGGSAAAIALLGGISLPGAVNAQGATAGGSIALIAPGAISAGAGLDSRANAANGTGGSIFVSSGSAAAMTMTTNITGTTPGYSVLMSNGTINGSSSNTVGANVGIFPRVSLNAGVLTAANLFAGNSYVFNIAPNVLPTVVDQTTSTTYVLPAGSLTSFGNVSVGNITINTPGGLTAPVAVNGSLSVGSVTGSGVANIALFAGGAITSTGTSDNSRVDNAAASITAMSNAGLQLAAITTVSSGLNGFRSGNINLIGSTVNWTGAMTASGSGVSSTGGNIYLMATGNSGTVINGAGITANGNGGGYGGNLTLLSPFANTSVVSISLKATEGLGGNFAFAGEGLNVTGLTANGNNSAIDVSSDRVLGGNIWLVGHNISIPGSINLSGGTSGGFFTAKVIDGSYTSGDLVAFGNGFSANQLNHGGSILFDGAGKNTSINIGLIDISGLNGASGGSVSIFNNYGAVAVEAVDGSSLFDAGGNMNVISRSFSLTGTVGGNGPNPDAAIDLSSGRGSGGGLVAFVGEGGLSVPGNITTYGTGYSRAGGNVIMVSTDGALSTGNINAAATAAPTVARCL